MIGLLSFALAVLASPFKSKLRLEAENAVLRHQLIVLRRRVRGRAQPTNNDRWFLVQMYRWFPSILKLVTIVQPETLVRWHRAGFRCYWRWKSRPQGGRPQIDTELRALIRQMSTENQLWGAPRIHGELLKLGFEVAPSSVAKYMVKRRGPPSQGWRTFLHNHAPDIAAMDLLVVPTIGFDLLYAFVLVRLGRRELIWINVTAHPTAEWVARQITEAFPWNEAPRYMIRDRDRIYGAVVRRRLRAMGIRDKPIAPASPWQNGFAERLIGSIRRECLDHIIVLGEAHLRRLLKSYARYYNETRTHQPLPSSRLRRPPRYLHHLDIRTRRGEVAGSRRAGFIASFLTKFAQSQFANWCENQAVIGPDTDGGFFIPRRKFNGCACSACFKRRREHPDALHQPCAHGGEGSRVVQGRMAGPRR